MCAEQAWIGRSDSGSGQPVATISPDAFVAMIEGTLNGARVEIDAPMRQDGEWWFDVKAENFETNISWKAGRGYGVYLGETGFGDRPTEIYADAKLVARRVGQLAAGERGNPALPMIVGEVRRLLGRTQAEIAELLHIQQTSVSRLEARPNPTLGTLRAFVEAMGGELEVRVRFPDLDVPIALPASRVEA